MRNTKVPEKQNKYFRAVPRHIAAGPPRTIERKSYAPKAFALPFTGFAPARRCTGTRSSAGSL